MQTTGGRRLFLVQLSYLKEKSSLNIETAAALSTDSKEQSAILFSGVQSCTLNVSSAGFYSSVTPHKI